MELSQDKQNSFKITAYPAASCSAFCARKSGPGELFPKEWGLHDIYQLT